MSFNNILKDNNLIIINENEEGLTIISRIANKQYKQILEMEEQGLGKENNINIDSNHKKEEEKRKKKKMKKQ